MGRGKKGEIFKWGVVLFFFFSFNFVFVSSLWCHNPPSQELPLRFGGRVRLGLPFEPGHLRLKGEFALLNFNFKGDIDLHVLSTSPLRVKFSSSSLVVDIRDVFHILKKLGYLPNPPGYIKGICTIKGLNGTIDGDTYSLSISSIKGPLVYGNRIFLRKGRIRITSSKGLINYHMAFLKVGKNSLTDISGSYSPGGVKISLREVKLNAGSLLATTYAISPPLQKKILGILDKYLPVSSFDIGGSALIQNVGVSLISAGDNSSMKLDSLSMEVMPSTLLKAKMVLRKVRSPMQLILSPGRVHLEMSPVGIEVDAEGSEIKGKDLFYPLEIPSLNSRHIFIPTISIKKNFHVFFNQKDNSLEKVNATISISGFDVYLKKDSYIQFLSKPIAVELKRNLFDVHTEEMDISVPKTFSFNTSNGTMTFKGDLLLRQLHAHGKLQKTPDYSISLKVLARDMSIHHPIMDIAVNRASSLVKLTPLLLTLNKMRAVMHTGKQGEVQVSLSTKIPLSSIDYRKLFKETSLILRAKDVEVEDVRLRSLNIKKSSPLRMSLDYHVEKAPMKFEGEGYVEYGGNVLNFISKYVKLVDNSMPSPSQTSSKQRPFSLQDIPDKRINISLPPIISKISKHYHVECDTFSYVKRDMEYDIDGLKADLLLKAKQMGISTEFYFCNLLFSGGVELDGSSNLGLSFDIRAISMPIDHLLGCFIHRAPIYITGDTNIQVNLSTHGQTYREVAGNISVDGFVRLDNGKVLKLSNLGRKVEMILEVLSFVGLNPSRMEDALPFNRLIVSLGGGIKRLNIKQIQIISPIILLSSSGYFDLNKEELHLKGTIKKSFLSKDFDLTTSFNNTK